MATNDGGPAFPRNIETRSHSDGPRRIMVVDVGNDGLSLRDYFAAAALTGMLVNGTYEPIQHAAEDAYKTADAMLAERAKNAT